MVLKLIKTNNRTLSADDKDRIDQWVVQGERESADAQAKENTEAWLAADPARQRDAERLDAVWNSDAFSAALKRYEREYAANDTVADTAKTTPQRWFAAVAAVFVIAISGLLYVSAPATPDILETTTAQVSHEFLEDGSALDISASSKLKINYSRSERHIDLLRGEAQFNVAKDASRPFVVQTRHASLKALGTVFNVDQRRDITELTVLEGHVEVTPAQARERKIVLSAGQSVRIRPAGAGAKEIFSTQDYRSWQQGILQADQLPLQEVVDELNRYRSTPLQLQSSLKSLKVTGTFRLDDSATNLEILSTLYGLSVVNQDQTVTLMR